MTQGGEFKEGRGKPSIASLGKVATVRPRPGFFWPQWVHPVQKSSKPLAVAPFRESRRPSILKVGVGRCIACACLFASVRVRVSVSAFLHLCVRESACACVYLFMCVCVWGGGGFGCAAVERKEGVASQDGADRRRGARVCSRVCARRCR